MNTSTNLVPAGALEQYATAAGGRFRVLTGLTEGDRTPILLIHGGGSDSAAVSWFRLIEPLSLDRPVIAPDLPGFGNTTGIDPVSSSAETADRLRLLLTELGCDRVVVCGVSMGGEIAVQFALRHPEATAALVAIAPGGFIRRYKNSVAQFLAWLALTPPESVNNAMVDVANRYARASLSRVVQDISTLPPEAADEYVRQARIPGSTRAYLRYNKAAIGPGRMRNNLLPQLPDITAPTLIFHGEDDPLVDPAGSVEAAGLIPSARLVMVPRCGHWAQLEVHDRFLTELGGFLSDVDV